MLNLNPYMAINYVRFTSSQRHVMAAYVTIRDGTAGELMGA